MEKKNTEKSRAIKALALLIAFFALITSVSVVLRITAEGENVKRTALSVAIASGAMLLALIVVLTMLLLHKKAKEKGGLVLQKRLELELDKKKVKQKGMETSISRTKEISPITPLQIELEEALEKATVEKEKVNDSPFKDPLFQEQLKQQKELKKEKDGPVL